MFLLGVIEKALFVSALLAPAIVVIASYRIPALRFRDAITFFLGVILVYVFIVASVQITELRLDMELSRYDLNKDGFFSGEELTREQGEAIENAANDTARTFAPFTAAVYAFFYVLILSIPFSIVRDVLNSNKRKHKDGI